MGGWVGPLKYPRLAYQPIICRTQISNIPQALVKDPKTRRNSIPRGQKWPQKAELPQANDIYIGLIISEVSYAYAHYIGIYYAGRFQY